MNVDEFKLSETGKLVGTIQGCQAFVPNPLPPPNLSLEPLVPMIARAEHALGELSGIGRTLPNPYLLIRPFMRREAVASSRIEGTVTTLSELYLFEIEEQRNLSPSDAREVFNYVRALEGSLSRLSEIPICNRLIRDAHKILMLGATKDRGGAMEPGEFKRDQNWIGARLIQNARFVPPPPNLADAAMSDLEKYINDSSDGMPILVKIALVHYQFEAIHPFPDGNGRVGRLLIPLMLSEAKAISQPLLYLSDYFEKNYENYIDSMLDVSKRGLWADWIRFFLCGLETVCKDAIAKTHKLQQLQTEYRNLVATARSSALLGRVIDMLFEHPATTVPHLASALNITYNAAKNNIDRLLQLKILEIGPIIGRPRVLFANQILNIVNE